MIPSKTIEELIEKHSALEKELSSGNIDKKHIAKKSKEYSKDINIKLNEYYSSIKGFCLHAESISFDHPTSGEKVSFKAAPDEFFEQIFQDILNERIWKK